MTGVAGTVLMGGAMLAAVRDDTVSVLGYNNQYATNLDFTSLSAEERKSDRLAVGAAEPVRRQIVQLAVSTRVGEKEIVRTVPFARVFAPLETRQTTRTADLPAFNPMTIFADAGTPYYQQKTAMDESEGDVSLVNHRYDDNQRPFAADSLSNDSVLSLVRQSVSMTAGTISSGTISVANSEMGANDGNAPSMQENVTAIPKIEGDEADSLGKDEKEIVVKRGDTLATLLVSAGATLSEARTIIEALSKNFGAGDVQEGQRLRYALSDANTASGSKRKVIVRAAMMSGRTTLATAALDENGAYMAISGGQGLDEGSTIAQIEREEPEASPSAITLYTSLYETGLRYGLPRELIDEMVKVYSYDYDFQRRVSSADSFEVFYAADTEASRAPSRGDILYAALTVGGTTKRFYRYTTDDDGLIDFYDENGNSAKKFLMRKPMTGGRFSSSFGFRHHPILGYARMHTGVDWAAPVGTPIMAAGSGTLVKAGRVSGYGNRIEIQHANGYKTTYNHMSAFASGIQQGGKVFQGQVIGYVGTTGLSTGAHLHYEVMVNGSFVDPMRVKVPRGRVLEGRSYADFQSERDRIDLMMRKAAQSQQVAQN